MGIRSRIKVFILALTAAVLFSGCKPIGEVQRRIVVHAIGIDPIEGGYEVSYQVFTGGEAQSGGPVDASESTVITLLAQGRTLYETEESLRLQTGKEVFLGDAELIVISEDLKDEPLVDFLNYFRRSDVYLGVNVVFCRGSAKDTIGAKLEQDSATAILLRGVVESAIEAGRACSSRIIEISNAIDSGEGAAIPVLKLEKGEEKPDDVTVTDLTIGVFDSAVISSDGGHGEMDENATMGLRLLRGDVSETSLEVMTEKGVASVKIERIKLSRKVTVRDGLPHISAVIKGKYDVMFSPEGVSDAEVKNAAEEQIIWLCDRGFTASRDSGTDLLRLKRMLEKYEPHYAENLGDGFSAALSGTQYEISAVLYKY